MEAILENNSYKRAEINGKKYYGKHFMLTGQKCNEKLLSLTEMEVFLKTLTKKIDMIAYKEPIVARFGDGIEVGISGVQLITTSAIMVHTNDDARDLYLDVFSCKWFDEQVVIDYVNEIFDPLFITDQTILRR